MSLKKAQSELKKLEAKQLKINISIKNLERERETNQSLIEGYENQVKLFSELEAKPKK